LMQDIRGGRQLSAADVAYFKAMDRKGGLSVALYAAGFALAFVSPLAGIGCAGVVAGLWFMPMGRINHAFAVCGLK